MKELSEKTLKEAGLTNVEIAMLKAQRLLVEKKNTRDIGKARQFSSEHLVQSWINNSKIIPFTVKRQDELAEIEDFEHDHNESGWDLLQLGSSFRLQVKYRGGNTIHLEQTRRTSTKNQGAASTSGHVVYSDDEFDVAIIIRPPEISYEFNPKTDILIFPIEELKDPKNSGFLYKNVPKAIINKASARQQNKSCEQILTDLYNLHNGV